MNARVLDGEILSNRYDDVRLYDGVRTRRILAFCIDYFIVALLLVPFAILVFLFGIVTLGLGWMLFSVLAPLVAILYVWNTLGGQHQATAGMRMMGIRLERLDGRPFTYVPGAPGAQPQQQQQPTAMAPSVTSNGLSSPGLVRKAHANGYATSTPRLSNGAPVGSPAWSTPREASSARFQDDALSDG